MKESRCWFDCDSKTLNIVYSLLLNSQYIVINEMFNPGLRKVFDQLIIHMGGGEKAPFLTPKPKVIETTNLEFGLVFTKMF